MQGMIIGAGYVGRAFLADWPNLIATTTNPDNIKELKQLSPHVEVVNGSEKEKLKMLVEKCDFAVVCVAPKDRTKYAETYLETAKTLSEILSERTTPFYLLYTSSTSVYGNHEGADVDESSPCKADSNNGKILIATEECYLNIPNIDVCILRLGGIYGPGRDLNSRAARFSGKTLNGRDIPTNSSSLSMITSGIRWCVEQRLKGIYNLVESKHPTRGEMYGKLLEKLNMPKPSWEHPHSGGACITNKKIIDSGFIIK